jgi:hypothetical protein
VGAARREGLNRALERIEGVLFAVKADHKRPVINITTDFALHDFAPSRSKSVQTLRRVKKADPGTSFAARLPLSFQN